MPRRLSQPGIRRRPKGEVIISARGGSLPASRAAGKGGATVAAPSSMAGDEAGACGTPLSSAARQGKATDRARNKAATATWCGMVVKLGLP